MSEIIVLEKKNALQIFTEVGAIDPLLAQIELEVKQAASALDVSTAKGRKEFASLAYKVSQSKTHIDGVGKDLVADMKELPKRIDETRKRVREFLDALRDEVRAPLTAWEQEEERKAAEAKAAAEAAEAKRIAEEEAEKLRIKIESDHELALLMNIQFDRDQADRIERDRLAAEERDRRIAAEAAEKAKKEAEQKAEQEKQELMRRELAAKMAEEKAIRDKEEAEARAKQAEAEAKRKADEAVENERRRVEEENRKKQEAEAARLADVEHRKAINRAVLDGLVKAAEITETQARLIVVAIAKGEIENLKIVY